MPDEKKRHTIYLSRRISRALKRQAAETDRDMSELVDEALGKYLPKKFIEEAGKRGQHNGNMASVS